MKALIFGGSASGKSKYGEGLACQLGQGQGLLYLATMERFGAEAARRIARHQAQREGLGFQTVECQRNLGEISIEPFHTVLLEDLGNLVANELFSARNSGEAVKKKLDQDLLRLENSAKNLVVVSCDLIRDGMTYSKETAEYLLVLEGLHKTLSRQFDLVVELVCGLPIVWKGEEP